MSVGERHLKAALRRLRLQAAVARAEQSGALAPADLEQLVQQLAAARREENEVRAAGAGKLPLDALSERLGLRAIDEQVLLAAVALESDPLFAITMSALAGEEPRQGVTAKLLAQLFGFAGDETLELGLDPSHALVRAALLESGAGPAGVVETLRPWRAASRAASFLSGDDAIDPVLLRCAEVVPLGDEVDLSHVQRPLAVMEQVLSSGEDVILFIEGPEGGGRRTLAAAAARAVSRQAVALDCGRLATEPQRLGAELRALRRECWLRGALPVLARIDALTRREGGTPGARFADLVDALESPGAVRGAAVVTAQAGTELPEFRRRVVRVRVDPPGADVRERLWIAALGGMPAPVAAAHGTNGTQQAPPTLAMVAQRYAMTPGVLRRAAANARMMAQGRDLTLAHVQAGVATEIHERFGGLATRVFVGQRWDDLVLPVDTLDDVRAFCSRAANAQQVYEKWGFRNKLQRGLGMAALFSGPPGTGKTMVAGLIANTLGLDLYMVDLSQVVSKWVGETEKQLGKIFDAAQMGQALLLFDEADALFAKRTEVKSSNDRYANLEVNYLLQRLEAFGGVAVLTTNLEASVDPAFKRRLAAEVRFYPPEKDERERLWRTLLPSQAPVESDLDFHQLAERYTEMCGGHIRNAVLRAAFLAAAEDKSIAQEHLHRAARTEYRAMGKVL